MLHRNLWGLCSLIKDLPARITLLSSGLLLERFATQVVHWCDDVIVSLDGSRPIHDTIRNVPHAFDRLSAGVAALKSLRPAFRVAARCVVQRANYADIPAVIRAARDMNLDQISFVAADVSTEAFNRLVAWNAERIAEVALERAQVESLRRILDGVIRDFQPELVSGFIAESAEKLRRLPQYFAALNGDGEFPATVCNAPWVSAVIEANGEVRPCFFHPPLGNIHDQRLEKILNGDAAVEFRRQLDVQRDAICRKCVCTLFLRSGSHA
jgi:radical SAM protein with 4Fe4S-binding SPASM domain